MKTTTRWTVLFLFALSLTACAGKAPIDLSKLPPIEIVISDQPPANTTPPAPPVVAPPAEPAPAPTPTPDPVQLQNLNIVLLDAVAAPVSGGYCVVDRDRRFADGSGFINFAVPGSVFADCAAPGFRLRHIELPPGDHRVHLERIPEAPKPVPAPTPAPTPAPADPSGLCAERVSDPVRCVRQVAAKHPELLTTNTYESCLEFTQRVLAILGDDWGHVGKTAGESQSTPPGFGPRPTCSDGNVTSNGRCFDGKGPWIVTGVSHDAIKHRHTGQIVDLLGNASANSDLNPKIHGPASIQWTLIPPQFWRENNPFVPAVPVR